MCLCLPFCSIPYLYFCIYCPPHVAIPIGSLTSFSHSLIWLFFFRSFVIILTAGIMSASKGALVIAVSGGVCFWLLSLRAFGGCI